jgi:hypothetical protein
LRAAEDGKEAQRTISTAGNHRDKPSDEQTQGYGGKIAASPQIVTAAGMAAHLQIMRAPADKVIAGTP